MDCDKIIFGVSQDVLTAKSLHVQIKDKILKTDKLNVTSDDAPTNLGGITFDLSEMRKEKHRRKKLQWYDLNRLSGMPSVKGQVRFSLRYTGNSQAIECSIS